MKHLLCLIHPIDPRGNKVGGIDTHVRMMITHAPEEWAVLLIGVDCRGDCVPGELRRLQIDYCALHGAGLCAILYEDRRALSLARAPKSKVMTLF